MTTNYDIDGDDLKLEHQAVAGPFDDAPSMWMVLGW
jgi:hypothetical protein